MVMGAQYDGLPLRVDGTGLWFGKTILVFYDDLVYAIGVRAILRLEEYLIEMQKLPPYPVEKYHRTSLDQEAMEVKDESLAA